MPTDKTVLVAGATGALGHEVAQRLTATGNRVIALSRRGDAKERLGDAVADVRQANALDPGEVAGVCDGVDYVFSSLGASVMPGLGRGWKKFSKIDLPANRNLIEEAVRAGVKKFVYVAPAGHDELGHLDYVRAHEQVVDVLRESGIEYAVIRATGFYSAFGEFLKFAQKGTVPLIGDGEAKTNPIDDGDLAQVCVEAFDGRENERNVGGPEVFTRKQIAELAFEVAGNKQRFRRVPKFLTSIGSLFLRPFHPRNSHLIRFYGEVWTRDMVAPKNGERRLADYFAELAAA